MRNAAFIISAAFYLFGCNRAALVTLDQARSAYALGNFKRTDHLLHQLALNGPQSREGAVLAIKAELAVGDGDAARQAFQHAQDLKVTDKLLRPLSAEIAMALGNVREANILALPLSAESPAIYHHIKGLTAIKNNDFVLAQVELTKALTFDPEDSVVALDQVYALFRLGLFDKAIGLARTVLKRQPQNAGAYLDIARIETWRQHNEAARDNFDRVLAIDEHNVAALLGKAEVLKRLHQYHPALATLDLVDSVKKPATETNVQRGKIFAEMGRPDLAIQYFSKAGFDINEDAEALEIAGDAASRDKSYWRATDYYQKAITLRPDLPVYQYKLIDATINAGDTYSAENELKNLPPALNTNTEVARLNKHLAIKLSRPK